MRSRASCQRTRIIGAIGSGSGGWEVDKEVKSLYVGFCEVILRWRARDPRRPAPLSSSSWLAGRRKMTRGALVVTGAGRGIGAQIAVQAARSGTPVALVYRSRPDHAARVVAEIEAAGGQATAISADVGSEADVARTFEAVDAIFGPV